VILTIIVTALSATHELSELSFRLLRWFENRPEHQPRPHGRSYHYDRAEGSGRVIRRWLAECASGCSPHDRAPI
jgi:hypothetical protein